VILSKSNTIFEEKKVSPKSSALMETLVNPDGYGLEYSTFVSACTVNENRVFWVIAFANERPHAYGECASFEDAEKAVLLSLKNKRALCLNSNFAWQEYVEQRLEEAVRNRGEEGFTETARLEFVYEKYGSAKYQVKRVSNTEIIVFSERYSDKFKADVNGKTFKLDKRELDNTGETKSKGRIFCTKAKKDKWDRFRKIPHYLKIFGLDWDANVSQVKYWFRKLSMEHHPDKGGNPEKFRELIVCYNKAVKALTDRDLRDYS
jgi:hypothetical protein